jgi:hypothetical protein
VQSERARKSVAAADLKKRFRAFEAKIKANERTEELDSETEAGLEALGYIQ